MNPINDCKNLNSISSKATTKPKKIGANNHLLENIVFSAKFSIQPIIPDFFFSSMLNNLYYEKTFRKSCYINILYFNLYLIIYLIIYLFDNYIFIL
jgi:hypothetical protein